MNRYECIVYNDLGKRSRVFIRANDKQDAFNQLIKKSYQVIRINDSILNYLNLDIKLKSEHLRYISKQIYILIKSGCSVNQVINLLSNNEDKTIKNISESIKMDLDKGISLSECFNNTKKFPTFFINMMKVGEESGNLDKVMSYLSNHYDREHKLNEKLKHTLSYPKFLILTFVICMMILIRFILPNLTSIYTTSNIEIPKSTQIVIDIIEGINSNINMILIIIALGLCMISILFYKSYKFKYTLDSMLCKISIVKIIVIKMNTLKVSRSLYIQLSSGLSIIKSINNSIHIVDNVYIKSKLELCRDYIMQGNTITQSLKDINIFQKNFIAMIEIGEESGNIDNILKDIIEIYEHDLDIFIKKLVDNFQPMIIIIMSLIIFVLFLSLLTPMMDISNFI